ncbi:hypothetical protein BDY19DRAFT_444566 [Irpex rosettiformis]|uniref:Uncharacterized protein n=1 Tax=Irpex rosettiformis TaxID=378272 RepID=A0ACB8TTT0_9APHY|nr:hypothetical protein BDY19DRAFT_444566 [Irpex rosettiformis]
MAAPRNNLKDVLANAPVTPSKSSKVAHGPSSTTGRPKFKPATASNPNSSIPDVRKTASYASFTTPGFGKTKPVPPLAPLNTHVASSSSSCPQPLAATSSSEAQAVPLVMNAHSFSKRASPASFSTIDPPLKRTRPSLEPDKENRIESDTQIVDLTEAEDSGYISLKGKGRDTSALTCPPPNTVTPGTPTTRLATPTNQQGDSSHVAPSSGMVRSSSRVFSFEFEDLLSMSDAELEAHRQEILNARGQIMDLRSQAERPLAAIFRKFE